MNTSIRNASLRSDIYAAKNNEQILVTSKVLLVQNNHDQQLIRIIYNPKKPELRKYAYRQETPNTIQKKDFCQ